MNMFVFLVKEKNCDSIEMEREKFDSKQNKAIGMKSQASSWWYSIEGDVSNQKSVNSKFKIKIFKLEFQKLKLKN